MVISKDIIKLVKTYNKANLINILNHIQQKEGFLSEKNIEYISKELSMPMARIYEMASFYSFFSFEKKGKHTIRICNSPSCYMNNSANILKAIEKTIGLKSGEYNNIFDFEIAQCIGCCDESPAMLVDGISYTKLTNAKVIEILNNIKSGKKTKSINYTGKPPGEHAMNILHKTNFMSLKKAKSMSPENIIKKVKKSGLTGRGGAGFSTGLKWEFVNKTGKEGTLICNFDEGEPGTFKDKFIVINNTETLIEGIAIASYALKCRHAYIYMRGEYDYLKGKLQETINSSKKNLDGLEIEIIEGAGAYICGDETSIMNSIEGKAGHPRHKPPYPAQSGLWQTPTAINNVETLINTALLFCEGWNNDSRLFCVSGDVEEGGVFEEKTGLSFKELIGKAKPKEKVKALFLGASGGCIPYDANSCFDYDKIKQKGASLGSCTIIVVDKNTGIVELCKNITAFFVHESCGKCTPCREGNYRILELLEKITSGEGTKQDLLLIEELCDFIKTTSFCPLGQSSCNNLSGALKYFRREFERLCK